MDQADQLQGTAHSVDPFGEDLHLVDGEVGADFSADFERRLVSQVFLDPAALPRVLEIIGHQDFHDPIASKIFAALLRVETSGRPIELLAVADELDRVGDLGSIGGPAMLGEVFDLEATAAFITDAAHTVKKNSIERQIRRLHQAALGNGSLVSASGQIQGLVEQLTALGSSAEDAQSLGFTGGSLIAIRNRPARVSPFPGYLPPEPALVVLNARPKTGKTTFAGYLAQAWACGVSPWGNAPALPGTRSLVISAEQPAERIDSTLRRMDTGSAAVTRDEWTDRVTLIARDPDLSRGAAQMLTLDGTGRAVLRKCLLSAQECENPFGFVVLDSLSRLTPDGFDENDNSQMTAWLAPLQEIAEESGAYLICIHHVGHAEGRGEARIAGRGASALGAVAQAIWLLENVPEDPRHRKLHVQGNAISEARRQFAVCGEENEPGDILYWRLADPLGGYELDDLIAESEELSTTALAWRVQGELPSKGKSPQANHQRRATQLRESWLQRGLIQTFEGPRGSKMLRRLEAETPQEDIL